MVFYDSGMYLSTQDVDSVVVVGSLCFVATHCGFGPGFMM